MTHIRARFEGPADESVNRYTASLPFDRRLYRHDIAGSIAHARMLGKQGILSGEDVDKIVRGLEEIRTEIERGEFEFRVELEDIHMVVESRLIEKVGDAGRKLHTARSRNDQVALDMRLFTKAAIDNTLDKLKDLQKVLLDVAEENIDVVMPGYTHLQVAQPVLLAHHLLAYFEMLRRDRERFRDCYKRADVMPLGSGALAGVAYVIDREFLASELGFSEISRNSIDAVADRDFIIDYEAAASICMMHLSRLAEEIVLWASTEFDFIEVGEAYATGSSIMPQKKNPDVAELGRGKTGRVYGNLMAILTTMKGLPLAYNKDTQEDKEGFFDTVDTLISTLDIFTGMLSTLKFKPDNMLRAVGKGYILATDLADYLVKKGVAFRKAHEIVAGLVTRAEAEDKALSELDIKVYQEFSGHFESDVLSLTVESSLRARDIPGGTAPDRVKQALAEARKMLEKG